ncbi:MAG: ABC transporter permease [Deltaproteobacteria bacterium]|nr:ABC transporter permease [Deltaproteobacteria bacterium]
MPDVWVDILRLLDGTLRLATPLILCAMAGVLSERSGIVDIGLEGKLLAGAFAAAAAASLSGSPWIGLAAAIAVAVLFAAAHGFACITQHGEQIISGLAVNILASGLTVVVGIAVFQQGGQTPALGPTERFGPIHLPGVDAVAQVPVAGPLYAELISGHNILVYAGLGVVLAVWWLLYRTAFGLRVRAVGEAPEAVETAGVSVSWLRYRAVLLAGVLCGIAGAYLSIAHGAGFVREMSAGKGYIALAAMIFGKWRPGPALLACLLFGFLDTFTPRLEGVAVSCGDGNALQFLITALGGACDQGRLRLPAALIPMLPYVLTVVLLAGFFGRAVPPSALGKAYLK